MRSLQTKKLFITLAMFIFAVISAAAQEGWTEMPLNEKYYGIWRIASSSSSRNDVTISSQSIMDGLVDMKILKSYYNNGTVRVITTLNGYFQSHFIKDRVGGIGNGGIYINSTNSQAYRSMEEALGCPVPPKLDEGFR